MRPTLGSNKLLPAVRTHPQCGMRLGRGLATLEDEGPEHGVVQVVDVRWDS